MGKLDPKMTEQEILISVAKMDGWEFYQNPENNPHCAHGMHQWFSKDFGCCFECLPGDYTKSHDAILPMIGRQDMTTEFTKKFMDHLNLEIKWSPSRDLNMLLMLTATPLQLCTALLKAKGVWREA